MALHFLKRVVLPAFLFISLAYGALTQVTDFGANPSNIQMYTYVPSKLATSPAVIVAIHYCGGSAQAFYSGTKFASLADQKGFVVIYPQTTHDSNCWDVGTNKTLKRDGGGDSQGIVSMVNHILAKYNADPRKVYAVGSSSGAMMVNVLAAVYPDVFAAASAFSGVAAGCLQGSPGFSPISADPHCANGQIVKTAQQWGDLARSFDPAYNGTRTRLQLWHGTGDNLVFYQNLLEEIKQWTNVLGVSWTKNVTNSPQSGYTQLMYGDGTQLVAYSGQGVGHPVPVNENTCLSFFGIA